MRISNFIVEGKCFIPFQFRDKQYDELLLRIHKYFYDIGYDELVPQNPLYYSFQQTFEKYTPDEPHLRLKVKKFLRLISQRKYNQEIYYLALKQYSNEVPIHISYSIYSAKKRNVAGSIMKIRIEPAIIYKKKQLNSSLTVDESTYKDIIDLAANYIYEFVDEFGFEIIEKPCATNEYQSSRKDSTSLITVSPSCFKIPEKNILPQAVSVMMPFKPEYDVVYKTIKDACSNIGLECHRADDFWNNSILIQDIFELIYCSSFVIVDLSGKNSNVCYEAGIAHTLGKEVISLTQDIDDVSFDLTHHRHIIYVNNEEGLEKLKMNLENRLQHLKDNKQ